MKCPQYIKDMLMSRAYHAERFTSLDVDIQEWLISTVLQLRSMTSVEAVSLMLILVTLLRELFKP